MTNEEHRGYNYWYTIWVRFTKHRIGLYGFYVICLFCFVGVYAPFFASSKPLFVLYDGEPYFPLFRYLFYPGFYTKPLDRFFNLLMFILPLIGLSCILFTGFWKKIAIGFLIFCQIFLFLGLQLFPPRDPASDLLLTQERQEALSKKNNPAPFPRWDFDLRYMNAYARLNLILKEQQNWKQHQELLPYFAAYHKATGENNLPTLWQGEQNQEVEAREKLLIDPTAQHPEFAYLLERRQWIDAQKSKISHEIMPLLSPYHWEDDAGGQQLLNPHIPWLELTRINHKSLLAALIFGIRISLVVGIASVSLALAIGIPIGAFAGFYGGICDLAVCRLLEIWEAMPTLFMLLLAVAILQTKSIFLVIFIIGFFGWTGFSRYLRGEFFKQRSLPYVEACQALGFRDRYIIWRHILPNAIPPVLTLLPFAIMGAISSEAALSFLGLGEEGSCSWGVLMDEGRKGFPQESYLMWPPAFMLTVLLIAIALVGDSLRDALDPKTS